MLLEVEQVLGGPCGAAGGGICIIVHIYPEGERVPGGPCGAGGGGSRRRTQ